MLERTIFRGATVIDGTGEPRYIADVEITGDRISAIGTDLNGSEAQQIDARGLVLAPGFIDVHTHDDRAVIANPSQLCKISQGVTTVITGNCGVSLAPAKPTGRPPQPLDLLSGDAADFFGTFFEYAAYLDENPASVNVAAQVGHTTLRLACMSDLQRAATAPEIDRMSRLLEDSIDAGAIGLSTGLFYRPAHAASTDEVASIAQVMRGKGAIYTTHMRDESDGIADSLKETFTIGRQAGVPVIVSHHKCCGTRNFGRALETLSLIDEAHTRQPVGLDVYPYTAASSVLDVEKFNDATRTVVSWSDAMPSAAGRDLSELAAEAGLSTSEMAARLQPAGGIYFMMDEADVRRILAHPRSMVGSDGLPSDTHPHPRLWGTFPRVLGHYARDIGLFPLEIAVHKMTALSALHFGLAQRGVIREGYFADLTLFDPATISDTATFDAPATKALGIDSVFVNGKRVYFRGEATGTRAGRMLRRLEAAA